MCDIHNTDYIVVQCHDGLICRKCHKDYHLKNIRTVCDNCNSEICGVKCKPIISGSPLNSVHQGKHVLICPRCYNVWKMKMVGRIIGYKQ